MKKFIASVGTLLGIFVAATLVFGQSLSFSVEPELSVPTCGNDHTQGLVSYWKADGDATDSFDDNDGISVETTYITGKVGQAFSFDGDDDHVKASTTGLPVGNSPRTIEAWVKPVVVSGDHYIAGYSDSAFSSHHAFYLNLNGNPNDGGRFRLVGRDDDLNGPFNVVAGQWYHLAATYDGTTAKLYVNGTQVASGFKSYNTQSTSGMLIGAIISSSFTQYANIIIDEVAIYNRTLIAGEVYQHYINGLFGEQYCTPPVVDNDEDGVLDDVDMCPGSGLDSISLNPNQYAQNIDFGWFEVGPNNDQSVVYDMSTTYGCTCTQIVEQLGAGKGHLKKGCSPSLMEEWTDISANPDRKEGIGKKK